MPCRGFREWERDRGGEKSSNLKGVSQLGDGYGACAYDRSGRGLLGGVSGAYSGRFRELSDEYTNGV
jgi:hypothetical protein